MRTATFFVIAALAMTAHAELKHKELLHILEHSINCRKETDVDATVLHKLLNDEITNDDKAIGFMDCMAKKMQLQNPDGTLNIDKIINILSVYIPLDEATKLASKCMKKEANEDDSKTAYNTYKCLSHIATSIYGTL